MFKKIFLACTLGLSMLINVGAVKADGPVTTDVAYAYDDPTYHAPSWSPNSALGPCWWTYDYCCYGNPYYNVETQLWTYHYVWVSMLDPVCCDTTCPPGYTQAECDCMVATLRAVMRACLEQGAFDFCACNGDIPCQNAVNSTVYRCCDTGNINPFTSPCEDLMEKAIRDYYSVCHTIVGGGGWGENGAYSPPPGGLRTLDEILTIEDPDVLLDALIDYFDPQ